MNWWKRPAVLAAALGAAWLHPGMVALAQEGREVLEDVVETRTQGNVAAEAAQKRIDKIADETDDLLAQYRTTWKQIQAIDIYNAQMRDLIRSQEEELASLAEQLDRVEVVGRSVTPLMLRMTDAIDKFVGLDVPFLLDERSKRIDDLRALAKRADVTTPEKFRQIMEAYQIENEYGRTIEAYRGTLELEGKETTVDFLRFGRVALVYQSLDETQSGVWNQQQRRWDELDSGYRSAIRAGLKIARKQSAPDLVTLPMPAPTDERGES